jgi:hypothetical protein
MLLERYGLRVDDVVYVGYMRTYAKVRYVNGLAVRLMTLEGEAVHTDRRHVTLINRPNQKELLDMSQEETIISIRIEGGYLKKGAVVVTKGDLAAVNTFNADGEVDWTALVNKALGEIAAAEILPLPEVQFTDAPAAIEFAAPDETESDETTEADEEGYGKPPAKPAKKVKTQPKTPEPALKPVLSKPKEPTKLEPLNSVPKQTKSLFDF